jgi:phage terminase small subunit
MRQRGRRSEADLAVIPIAPRDHRLRPPADLGATEAALFREVVASLPADHFCEADKPLLTLWCEAVCLARRSAAGLSNNPALANVWVGAARLATQMASKLRLCPSARSDAKTVARRNVGYRPSYYEKLAAAGDD